MFVIFPYNYLSLKPDTSSKPTNHSVIALMYIPPKSEFSQVFVFVSQASAYL